MWEKLRIWKVKKKIDDFFLVLKVFQFSSKLPMVSSSRFNPWYGLEQWKKETLFLTEKSRKLLPERATRSILFCCVILHKKNDEKKVDKISLERNNHKNLRKRRRKIFFLVWRELPNLTTSIECQFCSSPSSFPLLSLCDFTSIFILIVVLLLQTLKKWSRNENSLIIFQFIFISSPRIFTLSSCDCDSLDWYVSSISPCYNKTSFFSLLKLILTLLSLSHFPLSWNPQKNVQRHTSSSAIATTTTVSCSSQFREIFHDKITQLQPANMTMMMMMMTISMNIFFYIQSIMFSSYCCCYYYYYRFMISFFPSMTWFTPTELFLCCSLLRFSLIFHII